MFFSFLFVFSLAFAEPADLQSCENTEDCVPETECHPTRAINVKYRKGVESMFCTMDCRTILDCGRGEIKCLEGKCTVVEKKTKETSK